MPRGGQEGGRGKGVGQLARVLQLHHGLPLQSASPFEILFHRTHDFARLRELVLAACVQEKGRV